jgi:hypothetical protein
MRVPFAALAAVAIGLASMPASGQSLGEAAAREKERKEKASREGKPRPPVKVITEDELRGRMSSGTLSQPAADLSDSSSTPAEGGDGSAAAAAVPAPVARPGAPEKTGEELRTERQTEWRNRLQAGQAKVATLRTRRQQMETELADLKTLYGPNRASIANHLERAKADLAAAEQEVANLEDEGRRNRYR